MRALLALALIGGCGPATIAIGDYNLALARADCEREVRCGVFDTVERCVAAAHPLGPITASIATSVAAGLVTYDDVQAVECVAEHASTGCSNVDEVPRISPTTTCRGVLRAGRLIGDPCENDAECDSRSCGLPCPNDQCCLGSCTAPFQYATPGEDCTTAVCGPDSWCAFGPNVCVPLLPRGTPCFEANQCAYGLDCFDTCEPPPQVGDPCPTWLGTQTCGDTLGLACDLTTGACATPLHEGDRCDPIDDLCASGYLFCATDRHQCVPFPAVGEPCGPIDTRCTAGAACAAGDGSRVGTCVPLIDDGSPCLAGDTCASGFCDSTETCAEPPVCV